VTPFPWDDVMAFGLGRLRLAPEQFWRATPRELAAAAHGLGGRAGEAGALPRDAFDALAQAFPDG